MTERRTFRGALAGVAFVTFAQGARADEPRVGTETSAPAPKPVTLAQVEGAARQNNFDLKLAHAAIDSAEAALLASSALPNPVATAGVGRAFNYEKTAGCSGCSNVVWQAGLDDEGALVRLVAGKRGLARTSAQAALARARASACNDERNVMWSVRTAFVAVALAERRVAFTEAMRANLDDLVALQRKRYPSVIHEGDLARTELLALEAGQNVDDGKGALAVAKARFANLLGFDARAPLTVDAATLKTLVRDVGRPTDDASLVAEARAARPDLVAAREDRAQALAELELARRQSVPNVVFGVTAGGLGVGQDAASPGTVVPTITAVLPVFDQNTGGVRRAAARVNASNVQSARIEASLTADVARASTEVDTSRRRTERAETALLPAAARARETARRKYFAGSIPLMGLLDAERAYAGAELEYEDAMGDLLDAAFDLQRATGSCGP